MKHPALTRALAACLAVLCLVMLLAGLMGLGKTAEDNQANLDSYSRLLARIDEYDTVSAALDGSISYQDAKAQLDELQAEHDESASKHRTELATYTATRSGLNQGAAALDTADAAMQSAWEQYYAGLAEFEKQAAEFEEGYKQFLEGKQQMEAGLLQYETMAALMNGVTGQLANLKGMGDIIDSEDENARQQLSLAAYDGALSAYDESLGLLDMLVAQGAITQEQLQQLRTAVTEIVGSSPEEIRQAAQTARDEIAAGSEDGVLTDEQFAAIKTAYQNNRDNIQRFIQAIEQALAPLQEQLASTKDELDKAQAEMAKMEEYMELGKTGIEQGRLALEQVKTQLEQGEAALYDGRTQIWYNLGELRKQAEELAQEKQELDEGSQKLSAMSLSAQEQKELEQRQTSVRLMLLDRDGIEERFDGGMELSQAAREYADEYLAELNHDHQMRIIANVLMIIAAVAGLLTVPAAFEMLKNRHMLWLPPVLCLALAFAAECVFLAMGRGSSYSVIGVMIFAVVQLLVVLPGNFKVKSKVNQA